MQLQLALSLDSFTAEDLNATGDESVGAWPYGLER
jgi:hypothetical protein